MLSSGWDRSGGPPPPSGAPSPRRAGSRGGSRWPSARSPHLRAGRRGAAAAQARRVEGEIEAPERRLASFAGEEARLRELEEEARLSAETAVAVQRDWIRGIIAQLAAGNSEMRRATDEAAELPGALEPEAAYARFPAESEAAVIALGG